MLKLLNNYLKNYLNKKLLMIGSSHLIQMRNKYQKITNLRDVEYKIFSQNGEDGIIDYILYCLNINKPKFVEIGVGDYSEANTRFLFETRSPKGLIVDCEKNLAQKVSKKIKLWRGDLAIEEIFINTENIMDLLKRNNFENDIDLFSLDIDGIDYWILDKFPKNFSKIVILEFNSTFGSELNITVPNLPNFNRSNYHFSNLCFGMSLTAAINLMESKNFYFLGTNLFRSNAFFISIDYPKNNFFKNLNIENVRSVADSNFRESRDKDGNLSYLSGKNKIKKIQDCEVIDLNRKIDQKVMIKNLIR